MSSLPAASGGARPLQTKRFLAKRESILDAASALINEKGVRGLSLAEVGDDLGLSSTSITYYFKRRDDLAAACFGRALDLFDTQVERAAREPDLSSRVVRLVDLNFEALDGRAFGDARTLVRLSDLRATEDPMRAVLLRRFFDTFRRARAFFGEGGDEDTQLSRVIRTHVLLDSLFFLPDWLARYEPSDHARARGRLLDLLQGGIAPAGALWQPLPLAAAPAPGTGGGERFLDVATRLINVLGYRGASVDRIAAELKLTKGSFYHHLDAKDDLVLDCFRRSFATVSRAQDAAVVVPGNRLTQLSSALSALIEIQLSNRMPLLRSTALLALPSERRAEVIDRSNRMALRFAGMVIDGITEGSLRAVDPVIAGQVLLSSLNAAYELRDRAARVPLHRAVALYGHALLHGVVHAP